MDSARAAAVADEVLAAAGDAGDAMAASTAERALGLVALGGHDIVASGVHLRRAAGIAERAGLAECGARARISLVGCLAMGGDTKGALREADRAAAALHGVDLARARAQRAAVLLFLGRLDDALEGYRRTLPVLRRAGDRMWEARVLGNRGLVHMYKGALRSAEADLGAAEELHGALGQWGMAAGVCQNRGLALGLAGDIPAALASFDRADDYLGTHGIGDALALSDRGQVLLAARLVPEARAQAGAAVEALTAQGRVGYLATARLYAAEAALEDGDFAVAREAAQVARRALLQQRRPAFAALAHAVEARAAWLDGERSPALLARATAAADALAAAGHAAPALDARLLAGRLALELRRPSAARRQLGEAARSRTRGPVQVRARAWHAQALLRLADGDRRGAKSALRAGVSLLDRYRAVLGATELRAHAAGHVAELACLGLRLALEDGRPDEVLAWAERWRAGTLRLPPARPPDDERLAAAMGELRSVVVAIDAAASEGHPTARLRTRQAGLEELVRDRARHATGILAASLQPMPTLGTLAEALGDHALVEFCECDGVLHAVVVAGGRPQLYRVGDGKPVAIEVERVRSAFRRLSLGRGTAASQAAFADSAAFGARRLDELLLAPMAGQIGDRPLVVVPTGPLHGLPWSALPTVAGRPVSVAPSAAVWHRAMSSTPAVTAFEPRPPAGDVVLIAGPGLQHAASEVAGLARGYPGARRVVGEQATCAVVSAALDGASVAHVASHGTFRVDNPLFSCIQLTDGPLTVYDLEALTRPPALLVLSACESGSADIGPGDEVMGLVAALFALGTRTVVASVFPVPDDATRPLMLTLHAGLRRGLAPAEALARARARSAATGPAGLAVAAAFTCFGTGG